MRRKTFPTAPLLLAPLLLAACSQWPGGPLVMVRGDAFFDQPWPSDSRTIDGRPDLSGFPREGSMPLIDTMLAEGEMLQGFGLSSPIYLRFEEPINSASVPSPHESLDPANAMFLVDIDPHSPERGRLVPFTTDLQDTETTWQPENLLAVQPVLGLPLRSSTTYALVLTRDRWGQPRLDDGGPFTDVFDPRHPSFSRYQSLGETLLQLDLNTDSIAFATVFTTQDAVGDMARIVQRMDEDLVTPSLDQQLEYWWANDIYQAWSGVVRVPIWQRGDPPYTNEGGAFTFDDRGWPTLVTLEEVEFTFTVPRNAQMPEDGWPVVIYSHGTGGSRWGFANSSSDLEVATILADRGIAGFGISLPFHGDRYLGGDEATLSFNYLNPESGRTAFRQAALEQIWLTRLLTAQPQTFEGAGDWQAVTDPNRIAYMGHSHGAEIGIIAAPYFGELVRGVVLSGAGGGLSVAVVEGDAGGFDIPSLLGTALSFADDEVLDTHHPVTGLLQFVADATDPIHYSAYWHAVEPPFDSTPQHVLAIHGLQDIATPPKTVGAIASAADTPFITPIGETWLAQEFVDPGTAAVPQSGNLVAWDGSAVTGGVLQYPDQDHWAVFQDADAAKAYGDFLQSALDGQPVISHR